ncbi:unnamed protein product, partial [Mesorhabditis spiculigera]
MYAYYYALRRLLRQPDHNPLSACNLLLVVVDMVFIILATAHDYAAKIAEFETFVHTTLYETLCNCLVYQIPGYYWNIIPEKQEMENNFELFDYWLKIVMFFMLFLTDAAIIYKLYKMKILGKTAPAAPRFSKGAPSTISPSAVFIVDPMTNRTGESVRRAAMSRLKINVDTRLAIAFTYILVETIAITAYFKVIQYIPYNIMMYTNFVINTAEIAKIPVYVLIVTNK